MKREAQAYIEAEGLAAKLAVIQAHADVLLTEEAIAEIAGMDPAQCPLPELSALLLYAAASGREDPASLFVNGLLDQILQAGMSRKSDILMHWADPLLDPQIEPQLRRLVVGGDAQVQPHLRWHADLLARCRKHGVAAGLDAQLSEGQPPQPPEDGKGKAEGQDLRALLPEIQRLQAMQDRDSQQRLVQIIGSLLAEEVWQQIAPDLHDAHGLRATLLAIGGGAVVTIWKNRWLERDDAPEAAADKAHRFYDEALGTWRRLEREVDTAQTAQNQATLYSMQYEQGVAGAADKAHRLYNEALDIRRRLQREVEVAQTAQNQATLYRAQYRQGVAGAADKAHRLYDEALEILRRLKREVDTAITAQNQANLYLAQYEQGVAGAADKAHRLYDEALDIRRRLEREVESAHTAQSKATVYAHQYEQGVAGAADKAHRLYDEALGTWRRLEREVEIANTSQNKANVYLVQYRQGVAGAADKAHRLYDEALDIRRRLKREVETATTAQNQANLYLAQYKQGVAGAADKAHRLYDEALEITRRFESEFDTAITAQNKAALYSSQYKQGVAGAADKAHRLHDEALGTWRRLKREVDTASTAQNQANLYATQYEQGVAGAADKAHRLYNEALDIRRRLKREVEVAQTAQNQANLYLTQYELGVAGAADKAHRLYDQALEITRRLKLEVDAAATAQNQANLYVRQYEQGVAEAADQAHRLYDEALEIWRRRKRAVDTATTAHNQAALYATHYEQGVAGAADKAHRLYNEALDIRRRLKREVEVAQTLWNRRGLRLREHAHHIGYGDRAAAEAALSAAAADLDEAAACLPEGAAQSLRLGIGAGRVRIAALREQHAQAMALGTGVLDEAASAVGTLAREDERLSLLGEVAGTGGLAADAALRLGDLPGAVSFLERGRGRLMAERLRETEASLDAAQAARLQAARQAFQTGEARLLQLEADLGAARDAAGRDDAPDAAAGHEARLEDLRKRHAEAEAAFADSRASLDALRAELGLDRPAPVPTAATLRAALGTASLVQPVPGETGGHLLILAPGQDDWQVHPLPSLTHRAMEKKINDFLKRQAALLSDLQDPSVITVGATNRFSSAIDDRLEQYWDWLMGPVQDALTVAGVAPQTDRGQDAPEVVFCAPSALSMLPLAAARDPRTGRCFFDGYALRQIGSLSAVSSTAARADKPVMDRHLLVQDPLDDLTVAEEGSVVSAIPVARMLAGHRGPRDAQGVATLEAVQQAMTDLRPSLVTYFGHARWDRGSGADSAICLAAPSSEDGEIPLDTAAQDGAPPRTSPHLCGPREIRQLALADARLVLAICCEGGGLALGSSRDELVGLSSSLIEAGAAGVVTTLYPVLNGPSRVTLNALLADLERGKAPAQALRRAQMRARQTMEAEYRATPNGLHREASADPLPLRRADPPSAPPPHDQHQVLHPTMHYAAFIHAGA